MKIIKELIPYIVIIIVVILIRVFVITPVVVEGSSMDPTLVDKQILLLNKYDHTFSRMDIIVFDYNGERLVKRVIGLPGEHVKYEENILYINDVEIKDIDLSTITYNFDLHDLGFEKIPEGYYFVLGDNRGISTDSRIIGLISKEKIKGTTTFSLFPFNRFGIFK